ncbi:hypothetical protein DFH27DRAFT_535379 [Peziza echinospora]|nr:hypothetical protein DFH27DRAFT_535379 [Peziza echinospora]
MAIVLLFTSLSIYFISFTIFYHRYRFFSHFISFFCFFTWHIDHCYCVIVIVTYLGYCILHGRIRRRRRAACMRGRRSTREG